MITELVYLEHDLMFQKINKKTRFIPCFFIYRFYSYLKLSIGFNFAAFIAGITPDTNPTTTATDIETITGHTENGTL